MFPTEQSQTQKSREKKKKKYEKKEVNLLQEMSTWSNIIKCEQHIASAYKCLAGINAILLENA